MALSLTLSFSEKLSDHLITFILFPNLHYMPNQAHTVSLRRIRSKRTGSQSVPLLDLHKRLQMEESVEDRTSTRPDKDASIAPEVESRSSISSDESQSGVKNIEAVSQTWTQWSLIVAYVGSVLFSCHSLPVSWTVAPKMIFPGA